MPVSGPLMCHSPLREPAAGIAAGTRPGVAAGQAPSPEPPLGLAPDQAPGTMPCAHAPELEAPVSRTNAPQRAIFGRPWLFLTLPPGVVLKYHQTHQWPILADCGIFVTL